IIVGIADTVRASMLISFLVMTVSPRMTVRPAANGFSRSAGAKPPPGLAAPFPMGRSGLNPLEVASSVYLPSMAGGAGVLGTGALPSEDEPASATRAI